MKPNVERIVEAILFIIQEAENRKTEITQYDIVKTLFLADKSHLNKFGRPITYDDYMAMEHGPVPSLAFNLLREESRTLERHSIKKLPWKRIKSTGKKYLYQRPAREFQKSVLSPSDVNALGDALTSIKSLTFPQIRKLTHDEPAYEEAWSTRGESNRSRMSYALLFDKPNPEMAEQIFFASRHI